MVDLGVDLDRLRADFRLVRDWCVEFGEWTDSESVEIGAAIKAAVDVPDFCELAFWAAWMARYAEMARVEIDARARLDEWAREAVRQERGVMDGA